MQLSGAQLIIRLLEQQGISHVAGIPGGPVLPLYDALAQSRSIRHILARHEQGAGFIAQGMARVLGKAAVCIASSGPGATNLVTAVADAKLDSIPLVCITAQVSSSLIGTDAFQEVDTYGIAIPITKHNWLVRDVHELLQVIPDAFRIAESGRPGPVWIDIPKDVLTASLTVEELPQMNLRNPFPELDMEQIARAAKLINSARNPVLYMGGGVISGKASEAAVAFAEHAGIPTTVTLMALGAMPGNHPQFLGMLGMHGARYTNYALEEADLLIVLGARFDDRAIGNAEKFCPKAAIIHIDIDPAELGKIRQPDVAITGDVSQVLTHLRRMVGADTRVEWNARVTALKSQHPLLLPNIDDPRSHYGLVRAVASWLDDDAVIATDVGQHQMWVAQAYPFRRPNQWLTSGGLGTMGFGLPVAIGAALAAPERAVVCFSGDGSLKMNIQEMDTAVEEGVNIKVVLMDNQSLGLVRQQQDMFYGHRIFAADYRRHTCFQKIAEGFGMRVFDLDTAEDPYLLLGGALSTQGPCLIHCSIDMQQKVFPIVPPGAGNAEMIGG
jgi:acetolactate synthase I/II/III large subunit